LKLKLLLLQQHKHKEITMRKKTNKPEVRKTVFNIPSDEAKMLLGSITRDVYEIMKNEKFLKRA